MKFSSENTVILTTVDSTNNYATRLIDEGAVDGTVVLAHFQTNGKGQQGNFWESEMYSNLLFSVILYPRFLAASQQFYLSKIVSLALAKTIQQRANYVSIKWPNDLYVGEKKIGGILIEHAVKGAQLESSVTGIGLNVNQTQFISDAPNPVSLKLITGEEYAIEDLLKIYLQHFSAYYKLLQSGHIQTIDAHYWSLLFRNEGWHQFRKGNEVFTARLKGIGEFGQLCMEKKSGELCSFLFKEVEFV
jgi:BirA family biotin operon repressor/biotin-[acetyl-CoA-carboxylase] ligase